MLAKPKPIILAGGIGTRLWPLSRTELPKQFLHLGGSKSLLQQTIERLDQACFGPPVIICNEAHESVVESQCQNSLASAGTIVSEPFPLGTAGAIAMSAILEQKQRKQSLLLVVPVDSYFDNTNKFLEAITNATAAAQQGRMIMFGTLPSLPDSNYGYIKRGCHLPNDVYAVSSFHEKPSPEIARQMIRSGEYFWNSGIFLLRAKDYLAQLNTYRPDIYDACFELFESKYFSSNKVRFANKSLLFPAESVDKTVMEHSESIGVKPCEGDWIDMGSWQSLIKSQNMDSDGNAISGSVVAKNTRNSYLLSNSRLLCTVGIDNTIVVETKDAVLVANKDHINEIKAFSEQPIVPNAGGSKTIESSMHPWGRSEVAISGKGYLVKRLHVHSGHSLSLQTHQHRSEVWIVVKGSAMVLRGNQDFSLNVGESVHIPAGTRHRLTNHGPDPLEIIEVQLGNILDENDIQRIDDLYKRS